MRLVVTDGPRFGRQALVTGAVLTAMGPFGYNRQDPPQTTGQEVDGAIEKSKNTTEDVRQSAGEAERAAGTAVNDAAITAAVKAKLAPADRETLNTSVQTTAGRTLLQGTAPNAARATVPPSWQVRSAA